MAKKPKKTTFDIDLIRSAASHRWPEILSTVGGVARELLDGGHHPCPQCGGDDRFRMIDAAAGALLCNQCFSTKNGDGFAAIQWLCSVNFGEALARVADYLGIEPSAASKAKGKTAAPAKERKSHPTPRAAFLSVWRGLTKAGKSPQGDCPGWMYENAAGEESFLVIRYQTVDGKTYRPFHSPDGGKSWLVGDPPATKIPLYQLQSIAAADPDSPVYIVEGEKCVDVAMGVGLVATTSAHGSKSPHLTDWTPLAGRRVIILPDNDRPGDAYAREVAAILVTLDPPATVTIRRIPGLGPGGDIADHLAAGGTREQIEELADEIPGKPEPAIANEADDDPHRLARLYLDQKHSHPDGCTLRTWRQEYYVWNGSEYRVTERDELKADLTESIKAEFDRLNIEALKRFSEREKSGATDEGELPPLAKKVTRATVTNVMGAIEGLTTAPGWIVQPHMFGKDGAIFAQPGKQPHMIAFTNGILNIDAALAGEYDMRPPTPLWFSPVCIPYDCDLNADCPQWKKFLENNQEGDQERIHLLQEWAGYCLTDDLSETKFLILEGDGANGKSVFLAGLEAMLGFKNCTHVALEIFGKDFGLTPTLGKLANICGDAGEIDKMAEGHIKSFTAGNPMSFNRKGLKPIEAVPTSKLMLACNVMPRFADKTGGMERRIILVPWLKKIAKDDQVKGMATVRWWERSGELPGIFAWAIEGLLRLKEQGGFTEPKVCTRALSEYMHDANPTRSFLSEMCEKSTASSIPCGEIYAEYRAWSDVNGYRAVSERTFGKDVARCFPAVVRRKLGSAGDRFWTYDGICFSKEFVSLVRQQKREIDQSDSEFTQQEAF